VVSPEAPGFVVLRDVEAARLSGCAAPRGVTFVSISGRSRRISLMGNDLAEAARLFVMDEGLGPEVLFAAGNRVPGPAGPGGQR
jgi:hypothetical protein